MNSTKNLLPSAVATPKPTTLTKTPTTRFEHFVNSTAVELRGFAEQHPGMRITHVIDYRCLVFLTCRPDAAGNAWELRIARYQGPRPAPFSLAEEQWQSEINNWRQRFAVPEGAPTRYDPQRNGLDNEDGYAVLITWREVNADAPGTQLQLI